MPHLIEVAGETLTLCPERALFWSRTRTLLVADAHFGKAATFRARGLYMPEGTTADNLARLDSLLARWQAEQVVFLGDFFHAREAQRADTVEALFEWRERHRDVAMTVIAGNHDAHAGAPPPELGFAAATEPLAAGPFALRHHPHAVEGQYVLAGHLHPSYTLYGRAYDSARVPCFWFGAAVGVLPAFGAFTGAHPIQAAPGERIFLAGPDQVRPLPVVGRLG